MDWDEFVLSDDEPSTPDYINSDIRSGLQIYERKPQFIDIYGNRHQYPHLYYVHNAPYWDPRNLERRQHWLQRYPIWQQERTEESRRMLNAEEQAEEDRINANLLYYAEQVERDRELFAEVFDIPHLDIDAAKQHLRNRWMELHLAYGAYQQESALHKKGIQVDGEHTNNYFRLKREFENYATDWIRLWDRNGEYQSYLNSLNQFYEPLLAEGRQQYLNYFYGLYNINVENDDGDVLYEDLDEPDYEQMF